MRHAYAKQPTTESDIDRILENKEIPRMQNLSDDIIGCLQKVDIIFSSNALRAINTIENIKRYMKKIPKVIIVDDLYTERNNYEYVLWGLINKIDNEFEFPLIIGHNPGMTHFYNYLDVPNYSKIHFPTLGLAIVNFQKKVWNELSFNDVIEKNIFI